MDIDKFIQSWSLRVRWLLAICIWGIFVFVALLLKKSIGPSAGALIILPAIIPAWFLGMWPGVILSFVGFLVYSLVGYFQGVESLQQALFGGGLAGFLTSIFVSAVVGRIAEIARTQKKEILFRGQVAEQGRAQTRFLTLLNDIVQASLEAKDMPGMLNILVSRMGELYDADDCFITFWDDKNRLSIPMAAYGPSSGMYNSVVAKPGELTLTSSVLEAGHALVIENPRNSTYVDPEVLAPFPDIDNSLVLPLTSGEKKLGAIILSFHSPRQFSGGEISQGELAARQVSLALTKIMLLEESNKRIRELTGLYKISQVLHFQDISKNTFAQLSETMAHLVDARICIVCLRDSESDEIVAQVSAFGLEDEKLGFFHYPALLGGKVWDFLKNGIFCFNSIAADAPPEFVNFIKPIQVESVMAAPMWRTQLDLFGVLFAFNKPGGFNQDDTRLLGVFASQVSFVIQNIQLIDSERRRNEELSVLHAIATAATSANNEDDLIEVVTRMIGEKFFPDNFGILMLDEEGDFLKLHSSYRLGLQETPISIPNGEGITGNVLLNGTTRRVGDVSQEADYLNVDYRICSELCVPLKIEDRVIGVVNAESAKLNAFSQRDEDLLSIIAGQLATAIERLRSADTQYKQNTELERSNAMIKVLAQVGSSASKAVNPEGVMQTLGKELSLMGLMCLIALPEPESQDMVITYTSIPQNVIKIIERAASRKMHEFLIPRERLQLISQKSMKPVFLRDPIKLVGNILQEFPIHIIQKIFTPIGVTADTPICHLPLIIDGEFKGVFWLWGEDLRESDLPTMSLFGRQVAIALQNAHLMAKVQKMAITDDLTGVFSRGYFFDVAEREFNQARRYDLPLSVIILDIDHFKKFNDNYGHIVGDEVLRNVARVLQTNLRDNDTLGRYGGEEFSILMPITDLKAAHQVALRLRTCVSEFSVDTDAGLVGVKISVGVSQLTEDMTTLLSLINRADQAMYIAKSTGGNCVVMK